MDRLPTLADRFDVFGPEPEWWLEIVRAHEQGKAVVFTGVSAEAKRAASRERAEAVLVAFDDRRRRAEELLAPFNAFQVLAHINLANDRENKAAAGSVLHRLPAVPEYVALLLAARSTSAPTMNASFSSEDEESDALHAALREVTRWIEDLIRTAPVAFLSRPPWQNHGALSAIRENLLESTLIYEAKETDRQTDRVTTAMFEDSQVVAHLRRVAGFDVQEALMLIDTLGELSSWRLNLILQDRSAGRTGVRVAARTRVTVQELARASGIRRDVVERFVERFGLSFGAPPPSLSTSGETLTIEELLTLRARTENAGHGDDHERSATGR